MEKEKERERDILIGVVDMVNTSDLTLDKYNVQIWKIMEVFNYMSEKKLLTSCLYYVSVSVVKTMY